MPRTGRQSAPRIASRPIRGSRRPHLPGRKTATATARSVGPLALALLLGSLLPGLLLLQASPTRAQIVTNNQDDPDAPTPGSLRAEVEDAAPGATVRIAIPSIDEGATIILEDRLRFDKSLTIDNSNTAFEIFPIVAPPIGPFLVVEDDRTLILRDVALRGDPVNNDDVIDLVSDTSVLTVDLGRLDQAISVDITGNGMLVKRGARALALRGQNDFAGGIQIDQGDVVGDLDSLAGSNMGDITLNAAGTTARVVFEVSGSNNVLDATSPSILATESGGGDAVFVKRGSGDLDIQFAVIDGAVEFDIESGDLIVGTTNLGNGHDFNVESSGTLAITTPLATTSSAISGSGTVRYDPIIGAGLLTLTGNLGSFSGDLELEDGAVVLYDPDVSPNGSVDFSVDIGSNAFNTFEIADDDGLTFGGNLSGSGRFWKSGSGTTRLTGNASHTGGTTVFDGILVGNTNNLQRSISVVNGAEVHFNQASDGTFNGSILEQSGSIVVNKFGAGTLTLGATQAFAGEFQLDAGALAFASGVGLTNADLTVGNSSAGRVSLSSTFDSGGSQAANTVTLGGDLTLRDDSTLAVRLSDTDENGNPANRSTRFSAAGSIQIGDGSLANESPEMVVRLQPGSYTGPGAGPYTVLQGASLNIVEDFTISEDLVFFDVLGAQNGTSYQVSLTPSGASLESEASTHNQREVGGVLDTLIAQGAGGDEDLQRLLDNLNTLTTGDVGKTLNGLAGDSLSAATNVRLASAARTWRTLSNRFALVRNQGIGHHDTLKRRRAEERRARRLRQNLEDPDAARPLRPSVDAGPTEEVKPWTGWFEGSGLIGELSSSDAQAYGYKLVGPIFGSDRVLAEDARVGFTVSGTRYLYDADGSNNKGVGNSIETSMYGAWNGEPVEVLLAARYGHSWVDTSRMFQSDDIVGRVDGDFEGDEYGLYTEVTRAFGALASVEVAPFASLAYSHISYDDINETGSSALRMSVDGSDTDSALTSLGFRVALEREMDQGLLFRPRLKVAWGHEWADVEREVRGEFAAGGGPLDLEGAEMPRDLAEISVGWEVAYNANANAYVNWNGRFGEDLIENALAIGLRATW